MLSKTNGMGPQRKAERKKARSSPGKAPARQPSARFRPSLDRLDDRTLLSTLTVLNVNDGGPGSLRAEVAVAQDNDTIVFDPGLQGKKITLTGGPITINKPVDISGFDSAQLTVSGGGKGRDFVVDTPAGSFTVTLGLTITGGVAPMGGAILNEGGGTLALDFDVLAGNHAVGTSPAGNGQGGAVATTGAGTGLIVYQSTFTSNLARGADGARVSTTGNQVDGGDGDGGALFNGAGTYIGISGSTFSRNEAIGGKAGVNLNPLYTSEVSAGNGIGGAIYIDADGVTNSGGATILFSGNQAIGGLGGRNAYGLGGSGIGGAVAAFIPVDAAASDLTYASSTFTANTARGGQGESNREGGTAQGGAIALFPAESVLLPATPTLTLTLSDDAITRNQAVGGLGGAGQFGSTPGTGGAAEGGGLDSQGSSVTVTGGGFTLNAALGAAGVAGEVGARGGDGGFAAGGGLFVVGSLSTTGTAIAKNHAYGGSGGAGQVGGDGGTAGGAAGGGLYGGGDYSGSDTWTLSGTSIVGNVAYGNVGGIAGAGGQGGLGGSVVGGGVEDKGGLASFSLDQSSVVNNGAFAGAGGAGGIGGDGGSSGYAFGGGLDLGDPATITATEVGGNEAVGSYGGAGGAGGAGGSAGGGGISGGLFGAPLTLVSDTISANEALSGAGGTGGAGGTAGAAGVGQGGGVYLEFNGTSTRKATTISGNYASDGDNNVYGTFAP